MAIDFKKGKEKVKQHKKRRKYLEETSRLSQEIDEDAAIRGLRMSITGSPIIDGIDYSLTMENDIDMALKSAERNARIRELSKHYDFEEE